MQNVNPKPDREDAAAVLFGAAFGPDAGLFPLPAATDARGSWYRSIALAGQGRYAAAEAESDSRRARPDDLASLVLSTRASWLRQLGFHERARRFDGQAVHRIGFVDAARERAGDLRPEARCDALIGLAADALGIGRLAMADALLHRCSEQVSTALLRGSWRPALRASWVAAELAMMRGDGTAALRHARAAEKIVGETDSIRHRIKTSLVGAAALSCSGDRPGACAAAAEVVRAAAMHGQLPLQWAASMLYEAMSDETGDDAASSRIALTIAERSGGSFI